MNTRALRGEIIENGYTIKEFSAAIGMKPGTLYKKMRQYTEFTRDEIETMISILNLSPERVMNIFFTGRDET